MDTGCVQRIFASCDPCETCTLLKGFRTKLGNLKKLSSCLETAVFLTVGYNILCDGLADSGNILQKGCRRSIQIHSDLVYTIFHNAVKGFSQLFLVHIMLILTDTDGFRINLYKLCKRILYTSCDGCGASLSNIEIREFFRGKLACGIYRSTCLVGDNILDLFRDFLKKLHDDLLGFSGCRSVSYRDQCHMIFADKLFQGFLCGTDLGLIGWCCGINNCGIQNLSGRIYHCQLASGTEGRVPAKNYLSCNWRLHEKLLQIFAKDMDGTVLCCLCKGASDLTLNSRSDETFIAVLNGFFQNRCSVWIIADDHLFFKITDDLFLRCKDLHSKEFLFLTTVQSKDTMTCKLFHRLLKVIIHLVYRLLLLISCGGTYSSLIHCSLTDTDTIICFIRNVFCNDISGTADGLFHSFDFFFLRKKCFCLFFKRFLRHLEKDDVGQRSQTFFPGDDGTCTALRAVRTVKILYHNECLRCLDLFLQLRSQLALLLDAAQNLSLFILKIS